MRIFLLSLLTICGFLAVVGCAAAPRSRTDAGATVASPPVAAAPDQPRQAAPTLVPDPAAEATRPVAARRPGQAHPAADLGATGSDGDLPATTVGAPDRDGHALRVSYQRRAGKYPLIRCEQVLAFEPSGRPHVLRTTEMVADHAIVTLAPGATVAALAQAVGPLGMRVRAEVAPGSGTVLVAFAPAAGAGLPDAVRALAALPLVRTAGADYLVRTTVTPVVPNDVSFPQQWDLANTGQNGGTRNADVRAETAWAYTTGSRNVKVAIIDTGMDTTHPDLAPNLWTNPAPGTHGYANDLHGWNFVSGSPDVGDDFFHGTHVAGTIGAAGNNGQGITGECWQVSLVPLKALDANGSGYDSDLIAAISYATAIHADVINASWGGPGSDPAMQAAIAAAGAQGIVFVAAAGNDGSSNDAQPFYPACYPCSNIIAVAATDNTDHLAAFSNTGATSVAIAAPGAAILSTLPTVPTGAMSQYGVPTSYGLLSGTSMAAPHVTGAIALLKAGKPTLTGAQLQAQVLARVDRLDALLGSVAGAGRLNLGAAVATSWSTPGARIVLDGVAMSDAQGNADGFPNPGETVTITPTLVNLGGKTPGACTVTATTTTTGVTILPPAAAAVADFPLLTKVSAAPVRIQLASTLADGAGIAVRFTVTAGAATIGSGTWKGVIFKTPLVSETATNFAVGELLADPVRHRVYVIDESTPAVIGINTDTGTIAARAQLPDTPIAYPQTRDGQIAISPTGNLLYVCRSHSRRIQVYALPSLTPVRTLPCADYAPWSIAVASTGSLYVTSLDSWGPIRRVDPTTGAVLDAFGTGSGGAGSIYQGAQLRSSKDRTKLFMTETGLWTVGGPNYVYAFDVSGTSAVAIASYPYEQVYCGDFQVDESRGRVYTANGGIYGVEVSTISSGDYGVVWPFGHPYGRGVTMLQGSRWIYGTSGGPYDAAICRFDATTGAKVGEVPVSRGGTYTMPDRATVIGIDQRLVYTAQDWRGDGGGYLGSNYRLGIVGLGTLDLATRPTARIAFTPAAGPGPLTVTCSGAASTAISPATVASYRWLFDDGATASGVSASHVFTGVGNHQVALTITTSNGLADTAVATVRVTPPPVAVINCAPSIGPSPLLSTFDASGSTAGAPATIASYAWTFDDGTSASGVRTSHTFTALGTHAVTLAVTASDGQVGRATTSVTVISAGLADGEWPTYGAGPAHTGAVAVSAAPSGVPIQLWSVAEPVIPSAVAIGNGQVFSSLSIYFGNGSVAAYGLQDGGLRWSKPLPSSSLGAPAYDNGSVLLQEVSQGEQGLLLALDALTGQQQWSTTFPTQWQTYLAPTVSGGHVFVQGGAYGGILACDRLTGAQQWFTALPQFTGWTPAADSSRTYAWCAGVFRALDPATGAVAWSTTIGPALSNGDLYRSNAALSDGRAVVIYNDSYYTSSDCLAAIDLTSHAVAWRVPGTFTGTPAIHGGIVYAQGPGALNAYSLASGAPVTTYATAGSGAASQPIIADDVVIAGTQAGTTLVFDRITGTRLATIPLAGEMALSGRTLVIAGADRTLRAYLLPAPAAPTGIGVRERTVHHGAVLASRR